MTARSKAAAAPAAEQVPKSPPIRVEIRIAGRVRFAQDVYEPSFYVSDALVTFNADLQPTMVDAAPPVRPPTRFIDQNDPRDGEEIIQTVHSGRRDLPPPDQKDEPAKDAKKDEPVDETRITKKDENGKEYRICPQCGYNMYKQERTWTCENCGYSYAE